MTETMILAEDDQGKRFAFPLSGIIIGSERSKGHIHIERIVHYPMGYRFGVEKVFATDNLGAVITFLRGGKPDPKIIEPFQG